MKSTRRRDTKAELSIRRALHRSGLRFRVDYCALPGLRRRADVVFISARVVVFIDGCFWHCCPIHRTFPKANRRWWIAKLQANCDRDVDTDRRFRTAGWLVVHVWEHEQPEKAAARIARLVRIRVRRIPRQPALAAATGERKVPTARLTSRRV